MQYFLANILHKTQIPINKTCSVTVLCQLVEHLTCQKCDIPLASMILQSVKRLSKSLQSYFGTQEGVKFSDPDQTALKNYSAALRSWVRTLMGTKFFLRVQTGAKTHLVSCTLNIELLSQCVALTTRLEPKLETSRSVALLTPRLH